MRYKRKPGRKGQGNVKVRGGQRVTWTAGNTKSSTHRLKGESYGDFSSRSLKRAMHESKGGGHFDKTRGRGARKTSKAAQANFRFQHQTGGKGTYKGPGTNAAKYIRKTRLNRLSKQNKRIAAATAIGVTAYGVQKYRARDKNKKSQAKPMTHATNKGRARRKR